MKKYFVGVFTLLLLLCASVLFAQSKQEKEIIDLLHKFNQTILAQDVKTFSEYVADDVTWFASESPYRGEGKEAYIKGLSDFFAAGGKILSISDYQPKVQIYGDVAIVSFHYADSFVMGGKTIQASGKETLVFVKNDGRWWIVHDTWADNPKPAGQ